MPNPILDAARQRLLAITAERAALDREERELRAMVAAAEGASVPAPTPSPVFPWPPTIDPSPMWPPFTPAPSPLTPWIVAPHGGMCACPRCCPPWTLGGPLTVGDGWTSAGTTIYVGDVNPSAGSVLLTSIGLGPPPNDAEMLSQGWRRCGISDTTGGAYYVKGPDLSHVTLS